MESGNEVNISHVQQSFNIGKESLEVLRDINIELKAGEFISIVGQSGCGKSTLLRIIAGIDKPSSGSVTDTAVLWVSADNASASAANSPIASPSSSRDNIAAARYVIPCAAPKA